MEFVGEPVEYRDAGVLGELIDGLLGAATVLDRVVHPAEHPRSVFHRFFVPDLRRCRIDVGDVSALVVCSDLECAAGTGRRLLEDQCDVLTRQAVPDAPGVLGALEVPGQVEQIVQVPIGVMNKA